MNTKTPETRQRKVNDTFMNALTTGILSDLVVEVRGDRELLLCLRGGLVPEYINVYFKGHNLLRIAQNKQKYLINFNFNHARYTRNWEERLVELRRLGYGLREVKFPYNKGGKLIQPGNELKLLLTEKPTGEFWRQSISALKGLIIDFFDQKLSRDFFKERGTGHPEKRGKSPLLEKRRQQDIMFANADFAGDYYIYDMEYDQTRKANTDEKSGRFDMLALRKMGGNRYALVFMELKCTKGACTGKSGIEKHRNDLNRYMKKADQMCARKSDAIEIFGQYALLNRTTGFKEPDIVATELLFIFTDEAAQHAETYAIPESERVVLKSGNGFRLTYPGNGADRPQTP